MVNFGFNSANLLGIFLAVAGAALYFVRSVRPELSRDHDIFFAAVGLLCGLILLFHGWRLDPILQFSQFLLIGSAIFFAIEALRLRGSTTEQARRNSPIVDEDRPVSSRVYRAELEQLEGYEEEEREDSPRLRGYVEPPSRKTRTRRPPESTRKTTRSTRQESTDPYYEAWGNSSPDAPPTRKGRSSRTRRPAETETPPRRKSSSRGKREYDYYSDYPESTPGDYVDYQPIDSPEVPPNEEPRDRSRKPNSQPPNNFDY
jgi:hypothetical protein